MVASARALATVTPGFNRPTTDRVFPHRSVSGVNGNGKYRSICVPGANTDPKSNDAGITPTTVAGASSRVMARPTMFGSAAKRCFQSPSLNKTVLGAFHLHSFALNK